MIRIDAREQSLITLIRTKYPEEKIIVESLPLGDCIIEKNEDEKIIIERKSISDLISSIKDGRYNEQSFRLNGSSYHNHHIIYLIEGDVQRLKQAKEKQIVYSAIFSLNYFKGFSIMRTFNLEETATYICNCANKLEQKKEQKGYYIDCSSTCALAIMKHFKCFVNLMSDLQEQGENCLKDISWINTKGQIKKINKPCCANIVKFLV